VLARPATIAFLPLKTGLTGSLALGIPQAGCVVKNGKEEPEKRLHQRMKRVNSANRDFKLLVVYSSLLLYSLFAIRSLLPSLDPLVVALSQLSLSLFMTSHPGKWDVTSASWESLCESMKKCDSGRHYEN